jgi:hypothetical protein
MEQPTGSAPQAPAPTPIGPFKTQQQLFIAIGAGVAVLLGLGFYIETPHDVGKVEKLQVDDSDLGKLRGRTLREIGSFESEIRSLPDERQKVVRPVLTEARQLATSASSMSDMETARAKLQTVRSLFGSQGDAPPAAK